jgi:hypothetical protein
MWHASLQAIVWERIDPELLVLLGGTALRKDLPATQWLGSPDLWGYGYPRPQQHQRAPSSGGGAERLERAVGMADTGNDICEELVGSDGLGELLTQAIPALGEFLDKAGDGTLVAGGLAAPLGVAFKVAGIVLKLASSSVSQDCQLAEASHRASWGARTIPPNPSLPPFTFRDRPRPGRLRPCNVCHEPL